MENSLKFPEEQQQLKTDLSCEGKKRENEEQEIQDTKIQQKHESKKL